MCSRLGLHTLFAICVGLTFPWEGVHTDVCTHARTHARMHAHTRTLPKHHLWPTPFYCSRYTLSYISHFLVEKKWTTAALPKLQSEDKDRRDGQDWRRIFSLSTFSSLHWSMGFANREVDVEWMFLLVFRVLVFMFLRLIIKTACLNKEV